LTLARAILEALFAFLFLLSVPLNIAHLLANKTTSNTIAYSLGNLLGVTIFGIAGYLLARDSTRVFKRFRTARLQNRRG
jgi:hypothetical protein